MQLNAPIGTSLLIPAQDEPATIREPLERIGAAGLDVVVPTAPNPPGFADVVEAFRAHVPHSLRLSQEGFAMRR